MTEQMLKGRTAIVTGSGRNIGRAIAIELARAGANVVLNGRSDRALLESVAREIRGLGAQALTVLADVGNAEAVDSMLDQVVREFGSVDIAVSNVSVRLHRPLLDISVEEWDRVVQTNMSAAFYLARSCLPYMKANRWGRIIHISGRDGFAPKANRAHNVTAKAGVFALAKAIAVEFGEYGITANAVAPGIVLTQRDALHYPDAHDGFEARRQAMPLRRLGEAEDIAGACAYLCSKAGGYMTGQILHVNGGEFMF